MTISIYSTSAPVLSRMLGNLGAWLDKAQAHADEKKFDSANYLALRLAPDMLPFASQVRIASDIARAAMVRLGGGDVPRYPDDEITLEALAERVRKSVAFVQTYKLEQLEGSDERAILHPQRSGDPLRFTGETFLQSWALPNVYFHTTVSYALLRQAGVDLGKADYLGAL
jgi:hypothetical protein